MDTFSALPAPAEIHSSETKRQILSLAQSRRIFPNAILVPSIFLLYGIGAFLSIQGEHLWALPLSTILLTTSLLWAWYLAHDCAHLSVLRTKMANDLLGESLSLINGVSYTEFNAYRNDHVRHHSEKIDLLGVDLRKYSKHIGKNARKTLVLFESIYIPILFVVIKYATIVEVVQHGAKAKKLRALASVVVNWSLYLILVHISKFAAIPLLFAVCIRINVVRFVDAFQHSYSQIDPASRDRNRRNREYEFVNTFSIPVAKKFHWLNLFILNFGFHGAHHIAPTCPWYLLPRLNNVIQKSHSFSQAKSTAGREWDISMIALIKNYHKHRIKRIFSKNEGNPYNVSGQFSLDHFTGAFTDKLLG